MNTANLQLEGLYLAIASINRLLIDKGLITQGELDVALRSAETTVTSEDRLREELSPANRDAIAFPIRFLLAASRQEANAGLSAFSEVARRVGETKRPYNDQM